jgi:hypothetical protein
VWQVNGMTIVPELNNPKLTVGFKPKSAVFRFALMWVPLFTKDLACECRPARQRRTDCRKNIERLAGRRSLWNRGLKGSFIVPTDIKSLYPLT